MKKIPAKNYNYSVCYLEKFQTEYDKNLKQHWDNRSHLQKGKRDSWYDIFEHAIEHRTFLACNLDKRAFFFEGGQRNRISKLLQQDILDENENLTVAASKSDEIKQAYATVKPSL